MTGNSKQRCESKNGIDSESPERPDRKADVGILFVHGIGEQRKADALVEVGEALRDWLGRWLGAAKGVEAKEAARVTRAALAQKSQSDSPAHAWLRLRAGNVEHDWLLAESWWAEAFQPPTYGDLLRWSFQILPWTIASDTLRRVRLAHGYRKVWFLVVFLVAVTLLPGLISVFGLSLLVGVLPIPRLRAAILTMQKKLLGTVGDSYTFLKGSVRGAAMSSRVEHDLLWLEERCRSGRTILIAHSQGAAVAHATLRSLDAGASVPRPPSRLITFGAGLRKLILLDRLNGRQIMFSWCLSIGLLILSWGIWQTVLFVWSGTKIDYQARFGADPRNWNGLDLTNVFELGLDLTSLSGLALVFGAFGFLQGFVMGGRGFRNRLFMATFLFAYYAGLTALIYWPVMWGTIALLLPGALMAGAGAGLGNYMSPLGDQIRLARRVRWRDFYATSDPVPNGPLIDNEEANGLRKGGRRQTRVATSSPVSNRGSIFGDHTSYWRNADEFVTAVACGIGNVGGLNLRRLIPWDTQRIARARERRRWRVGWLRFGRVSLLLSALALAFAFRGEVWNRAADVRPQLLLAVAEEGVQLLEGLPVAKHLIPPQTYQLLPCILWFAVAIAAFLAARGLVLAIWSWWDRVDEAAFFERRDYVAFPVPFALLLSLLAAGIGVAVAAQTDWLSNLLASDPEIAAINKSTWAAAMVPPHEAGIVTALMIAAGSAMVSAGLLGMFAMWWNQGLIPLLRLFEHHRVKPGQTAPDQQDNPDDPFRYMVSPFGFIASLHVVQRIVIVYPVVAAYTLLVLGVWSADPATTTLLRMGGVQLSGTLVGFIAGGVLAMLAELLGIRTLGKQMRRWSCAGAIGSWMAQARATVSWKALARRADEIVAGAERGDGRSTRQWEAQHEEAEEIIRMLCLVPDNRAALACRALAERFPYAAVTMASCLRSRDPDLVLSILRPHRHSQIPHVRFLTRRLLRTIPNVAGSRR